MSPQLAFFEISPWRYHSPVPFATFYDKPYSMLFEVAPFFSYHFCENKRKEWVSSQITKKIMIWEPKPNKTFHHQTWNTTTNTHLLKVSKFQNEVIWIWTKYCEDFCFIVWLAQYDFWFIFWKKRWLHKFILKFTDI